MSKVLENMYVCLGTLLPEILTRVVKGDDNEMNKK